MLRAGAARARRAPDDTVVATVMSNLGFHHAMRDAGIAVQTTAVGDRYVLEAMRAGGPEPRRRAERAPRVPRPRHHRRRAAHRPARCSAGWPATGASLAELAAVVHRLPQVLVNVPVTDRTAVAGDAERRRRRRRRRGRARRRRPGAAAPVRHRAAGPRHGRGAHPGAGRRRRRPARGRRRPRRLSPSRRQRCTRAGWARPPSRLDRTVGPAGTLGRMCGIVGYVGRRTPGTSCWRGCGGWSTAATTPPASPSLADGELTIGEEGRQARQPGEGAGRARPLPGGHHGHRAHPVGHPRRPDRPQRPPAPSPRTAGSPSSTTASSRTSPRCAPS